MKHSATLIEKFLRGECNEQEKQAVQAYIAQHPEALLPYLTEESWHAFHPAQSLPEDISGKMLSVIESRTFQKRRINRRYYSWAAAALLLVSGGLLWTTLREPAVKNIAAVTTVPVNKSAATALRTVFNHSRHTMPLTLSDGSKVELAPESEIRYQDPFTGQHRDIYLKGQALFRVSGSPEKPFTVYAGNVGTTALGTVFKITAWANKGITQVQLISGKVMVRPEQPTGATPVKDIYLLPGQDLRYDQRQLSVVINQPVKKHNDKQTPIHEVLTFNNEPLESIFRQMSEKYQVKIQYTASTLTGMNFTGVFDSNKETLKDFLTTIGTLNNLTINQKDNVSYIVQ
ncbi:FecR family protein [Chitinophaga arvensicola]|uniref:Ferric-dicitrate binding protein FerR, regulates iron transport through sigma-19 n=1 Tax=Chitinophaga arvensicola TaxID=29529 RepID=A0A1I0S7I1_9BACT|nr:FecR family protein [Chitinophaga arvensicola]SEW51709.1 ferric-dicitrate binding protein FerR, regulates iron transport through sigma-19 [Chitinophaga arvensicola]